MTTTPFRIATFHQFDTSQWSDPVSYSFELLSPENGGIVSLNQIGDFEWFSDMESEARLIIGKSRDERGKIIPDFEAKNVDHTISLSTSESVALFDDIGEYYWSIILKESEFYEGIFLSKQGSFTIEEKPLSTPTQQLAEVWPNPVTGSLTVETNGHSRKKIALVDLSGKMVLAKNTNDQTIVINTEGIKNGVYLLQVTTSDNSYTHKVIIAN
ncbi:MAG: T9SS type A sorting domain-containing protein [Cytophagales bacterium]|nr:T9SS type A sorting domain-containing protein [Cytophagales bacterium]